MSTDTNIFFMQQAFRDAGECESGTVSAEALAVDLVAEEYHEFMCESVYYEGGVNILKEAIDLMYVTAQYLNTTIGPELATQLLQAVHANNMSKCVGGKLVKREDGKVLKPEGYKKFNITEWMITNAINSDDL